VIQLELDHPSIRLGVVHASGVRTEPSAPALLALLDQAEAAVRADAATRFPENLRAAVRNVLRKGGYKPTGRGKPASEFLLGAALEAGMPRINNLVDINNLASLEHAHPISILDLARTGSELTLRFGREDERYVFNASGQTMDIAGLPVVCMGSARDAVANAVKDSMLGKVQADTREVLAVVYGTRELPEAKLVACCERLATLLRDHAHAERVAWQLVPSA
jgi:DNA/RNA-binding domain of Phe-tRNA-synthetase-like protein